MNSIIKRRARSTVRGSETEPAVVGGTTASAQTSASLPRLVLPLLLNSLLGLITTLLDTLIISAYSESAAAAVSLANQILVVGYDLSILLGVGATILITHALGAGEAQRAGAVAAVSIGANTILGAAIGLLLWLLKDVLISLIHVPPAIIDDTSLYVTIIAAAMPFNAFLMAAVASLRGYAKARVILVLGLVAFPTYLALDYALVLGFGVIPSLGVLGSALATLLVRLGSVAVLFFLLPRVIDLRWNRSGWGTSTAKLLRRLTALSSPSVLDNVAYGFYQLVLVSFIAGQGVVAVVARFYTLALTAFLPVLIMAFSQANEVLVGYRHGAGCHAVIYAMAWRSALIAAGVSTLAACAAYVWSEPLVNLFSDDPQVQATAKTLLGLTVAIQPLSGINTVLFHSLRVTGDVRAPVAFSQGVMWAVAVPLGYWFSNVWQWGVAGLWYAMLIEEAAKTIFMVLRWSSAASKPRTESA